MRHTECREPPLEPVLPHAHSSQTEQTVEVDVDEVGELVHELQDCTEVDGVGHGDVHELAEDVDDLEELDETRAAVDVERVECEESGCGGEHRDLRDFEYAGDPVLGVGSEEGVETRDDGERGRLGLGEEDDREVGRGEESVLRDRGESADRGRDGLADTDVEEGVGEGGVGGAEERGAEGGGERDVEARGGESEGEGWEEGGRREEGEVEGECGDSESGGVEDEGEGDVPVEVEDGRGGAEVGVCMEDGREDAGETGGRDWVENSFF